MRNGGNVLINKVFEANLTETQKSVVKPDKHTDLDPRSLFIYDKYQHRKWYDEKLARRKSTFEPPVPDNKRVSAGEFDDFFAARTKTAASDDWHDSRHDSNDIHFDADDEFANMASNSISAMSAFQITKQGSQSPVGSKSARGGLSYTRTPKAGSDGRANVALARIDSKQEMLNTIRTFNIDQESQNILPNDVIRRKKTRSKDIEQDRRRGSGDSDSKASSRIRRVNSNESEGSGVPNRRAPSRTTSMGSEDGSQKPRSRRLRGASSSEERNDLNPASRQPRREPTRGVSRTKSMDDSSFGSPVVATRKQETTSRIVKRGVRRSMSSDDSHSLQGESQDGSLLTQDADASLVSGRSTTKRPPRRPRPNGSSEQKQVEAAQMNESLSSRRSRHDDPTRRRRSPGRSTSGEGDSSSRARSSSRTSNRRRNKSQPRKAGGNAIRVTRVATVRDRSPKPPGERSEQ